MDRRHFIAAAGSTVLAARQVAAAAAAANPVQVVQTRLAERLWLLSGAGGNVTVFDSSEGVLLVDGGAPEHSAQLLQAVRDLTGKSQVHTLFNTHWHHDQTGSNLPLGKAGTRIIAHEYTRLWLTTDVECRWEGRTYQPLPKVAQPSKTFYTTGSLSFGGEQIDYGHLGQAHTDGDIYVHFRSAKVLVAGDVVSAGRFPIVDPDSNGWIGGLAAAVETLTTAANADTQVVPGMGMPRSLAHLNAQLAMLNTVRQRLARLMAQGMSASEMIEARPAAEFEAEWGDPALFIRNAYPGMSYRSGQLGVSIV